MTKIVIDIDSINANLIPKLDSVIEELNILEGLCKQTVPPKGFVYASKFYDTASNIATTNKSIKKIRSDLKIALKNYEVAENNSQINSNNIDAYYKISYDKPIVSID